MPPKKGAKGGKKGGGGGDEAGRLFREPLPEKEPLADVPPLSRAAVRPLPLLPLWQDPAEIEGFSWDGEGGEAFVDGDGLPTLPASLGSDDVAWRRPGEYWRPPTPEPLPEGTDPDEAPPPPGLEVVLLPPPPYKIEEDEAPKEEEPEDPKAKKGKDKKGKDKGKGKGKGAEEEAVPAVKVPREIYRPVGTDAGADGSPELALFASVLRAVGAQGGSVANDSFLWESIFPKGPDTRPRHNASGKYRVRMWWAGAWRCVEVDDRMPFRVPRPATAAGGDGGAEDGGGKEGGELDGDEGKDGGNDDGGAAGAGAGADGEGEGARETKLFPFSSEERELWPCILFKAWLKVSQGVPGAGTDASLMLHALTGWLPQSLSEPLSGKHWAMLQSMLPLNRPSLGEHKAANKALHVENLRRKAEIKRIAEEKATRAAERQKRIDTGQATSDDELESVDTDELTDSEGEDGAPPGTAAASRAGSGSAAGGARSREPLPFWADAPLTSRAIVLALQCTRSGEVPPAFTGDDAAPVPLQEGLLYSVVAARDCDGERRVLLAGQPTPLPDAVLVEAPAADGADAAADGEGVAEGKGADGEGGGEGDGEGEAAAPPKPKYEVPYQDERTHEAWVAVDDLPNYFGAPALALHNTALAHDTQTVHAHWRQKGEAEFGGAVEEEAEDPKAKKGKGKDKGKGKGKGAAVEEEEVADEPVNERAVALPPSVLWVRGGDAGASVVVCMWRDPAAPRDDSGDGDGSAGAGAMFGGSALLTVEEDVSWDALLKSSSATHAAALGEAQASLEVAEAEAKAAADAAAAEAEAEAEAGEGGGKEGDVAESEGKVAAGEARADPARAVASVPAFGLEGGLRHEDRLRVQTPRVLSKVLRIPPGQHVYALTADAPTGYAVTFALPDGVRVGVSEPLGAGEAISWDGIEKLPLPKPKPSEGEEEPEPEPEPEAEERVVDPLDEPREAVAALARPAIASGEAGAVLAAQCGAHVVAAPGTVAPTRGGEWTVWFRKTFKVPVVEAESKGDGEGEAEGKGDEASAGTAPRATLWANLHLWDPAVARYVRLYTVNNDNGEVVSHPLLSTGPATLEPNATGYTLMAAARRPPSSDGTQEGDLPGGFYRLTLVGTEALEPIVDTAAALEESGAATAAEEGPAVQAFEGTYAPNKYWTLFEDMAALAQPGPSVSVRLTASRPNVWVRLEAVDPASGDVVARQMGQGAAMFVSLPPATSPAAAAEGEGGDDADAGPDAEADPLGAAVHAINKGVLEGANFLFRGSIESERWAPTADLVGSLPFADAKTKPAAADGDAEAAGGKDAAGEGEGKDGGEGKAAEAEPLKWRLSVAGTVGGARLWVDSREVQRQAAIVQRWEDAEEGRAAAAAKTRAAHVEMLRREPGELGPEIEAAEEEDDDPKAKKGKDKGKGKGKGADDGEDEEAAAARKKVAMERRRRALANGVYARVELGADGKVAAAGPAVVVVDGAIQYEGASELPVLPVERIKKELAAANEERKKSEADGAEAGADAAEGDAAAAPVTSDSLYVAAMHEARAREFASRKQALAQQQAFMAQWRKDHRASLATQWEAREAFRAQREEAELARLKAEAEAKAKAEADAEEEA